MLHRFVTTCWALVALTTITVAQSPLRTFYASDNQGAVGGSIYFDVTLTTSLLLQGLDCNLASAAGTAGTIRLYTRAGTSVGVETTAAAWGTPVASAAAVSAGLDAASSATFAAPALLTPGNYGIRIEAVGLAHAYTNANGANDTFGNFELTLRAGSAWNGTGAAASGRVFNGAIRYDTLPGYATFANVGHGCYELPVSVHESFAPGAFDLAGPIGPPGFRSIAFTRVADGYVVAPGSGNWNPPTSANLGLGDDAVSPALALPFTFAYPGGATTAVQACSNGYLWLQPSQVADVSPTTAELFGQGARFCPLWLDLDPSAGGSVHFDLLPGNTGAVITWLAVPDYGAPASLNSFQVALFANGNAELRWSQCRNTGGPAIVGFSEGNNVPVTATTDLSALPVAGLTLAPGSHDLALSIDGRPVLGTTINMRTSRIPSNGTFGAVVMSLDNLLPGVDLTVVGMPGCVLYLQTTYINLFVAGAGSGTYTLAIPLIPTLSGLDAWGQSGVFAAGFNAFGMVTSQAVRLRLGVF